MTSSPSFTPNQRSIIIAAEVQEFTQSTSLAPENCLISSSKALTLGPVVIQPERKESTTSLITSSLTYGGENGIFIFLSFLSK